MNKPNTITSLSKERLEDLCMDLMYIDGEKTNTIAKLQKRIDKAIEYIENNSHYYNADGEIMFVIEDEETFYKEIIKILAEADKV